MTMGYNKYRDYSTDSADDYKAKCALAEKLGDVKLRQWCVEILGVTVCSDDSLSFAKIESLFEYIKGNRSMA